MTAETFGAFQRQGQGAFDALVAGGLTSNEALQQMAPFLQSAIDASQNFGVELDENTRSLIAQAEASGIAFEIDPMVQMADTLVVIAELLGATSEQLAGIGSTGAEAGTAISESFSGIGAGAQESISGVGDEIAMLPQVAAESVIGISESFASGTEAITSGLDPVAEKMATEIREAGESTSAAIDQSFDSTNQAIKAGLGEVAATFGGEVVSGALAAASAADRITEAANNAAKAAASISFPDFPDGGDPFGGSDQSSASGFRGVINKTTRFTAHAGELVNILPAGVTNSLRAKRSSPNTVSAQSGFGGISIEMGGLQLAINAPVERGEDGQERIGITRRELQTAMREIIDNDLGGMVTDSIREQLFEQT